MTRLAKARVGSATNGQLAGRAIRTYQEARQRPQASQPPQGCGEGRQAREHTPQARAAAGSELGVQCRHGSDRADVAVGYLVADRWH
jgi:hypothetical protein